MAPLLQNAQSQGVSVFLLPIGDDLVPGESALTELDALETITFIGYPNGIWDSKNFLPIIRRGITATPISVDFQGEQQFLIDASVFPGSSGSPVFLLNVGMYTDKKGVTTVGSRVMFLGVVASVFYQRDLNEITTISQPTVNLPVAVSRQMIDLGVVFKARTVIETIDDFISRLAPG